MTEDWQVLENISKCCKECKIKLDCPYFGLGHLLECEE